MDPPRLIINNNGVRSLSPPLFTRHQSTPSPSSTHSSSSTFSSMLGSPIFALDASQPITAGLAADRRQSTGSVTSWGSAGEAVFKPPDDGARAIMLESTQSSDSIASAISGGSGTSGDSPITTPPPGHVDHFNGYFMTRNGNISPASSATSTAPSKGGVTPRAELPAPVWPLQGSRAVEVGKPEDAMDLDAGAGMDAGEEWQRALHRGDSLGRRKHSSLDTAASAFSTFIPTGQTMAGPSRDHSSRPPSSYHPPQRISLDANVNDTSQRVVAQSSTTGCRISAPLSPPAHYPGSARANGRKPSPTRSIAGASATSLSVSGSESNSMSSWASSDSIASQGPLAPRWAHPPRYTNKISGRAWSFSQGQERPDIDFDPELFDTTEPESVQEILKGMEGRIAVKTTPVEYNIMAWLPGFSINDITISMKGDRTVQIVADLWDEGDHAQWNVLLGEDVNKSAISATFKGHELRVTVKRNVLPSNASALTGVSSWSAPAVTTNPGLAVYPRRPTVSH